MKFLAVSLQVTTSNKRRRRRRGGGKKAEDGTALTDIRKLSRQFRDLTERDPVTKDAARITNPSACRNDCYAAR